MPTIVLSRADVAAAAPDKACTRHRPVGHSTQHKETKEQMIVSAQYAETGVPAPLPLRTIGDIRAALLAGHGFPGDKSAFETDLQRALEASSETDLTAVAAVIVDYKPRGVDGCIPTSGVLGETEAQCNTTPGDSHSQQPQPIL